LELMTHETKSPGSNLQKPQAVAAGDTLIITRGNKIGTYLICLDCESPFQQFSYDSKGYETLAAHL